MTRLAIGVSLVLFAGLALAHSHGQENERFAAAGFAGVGKTKPAVTKVLAINGPIRSQSADTKPSQSVTLHNRRHTPSSDNWKESIVSFRHERLYFAELGPHNEWDLVYGDLDYKGDRDWLKVNCDRNTWSRIRDLGELDWSDDIQVPVLPTLPCGTNEPCGRIQIPPSQSGKKIEDEDLNPHIAKPKVGHMYVVHRYRERRRNDRPVFQTLSDYYTLIRVEDLKPNESCTITWKRVPTPK